MKTTGSYLKCVGTEGMNSSGFNQLLLFFNKKCSALQAVDCLLQLVEFVCGRSTGPTSLPRQLTKTYRSFK
jgi:hypothetical protein